jgi:hypothetical protein
MEGLESHMVSIIGPRITTPIRIAIGIAIQVGFHPDAC